MWFGHGERRADVAGGQRGEEPLLLLLRGDLGEHVHIALIGCHAVENGGPDRRVSCLLEHRGPEFDRHALAAPLGGHVWSKDSGLLGFGLEVGQDRFVEVVPGMGLGGHDHVADEGACALAQLFDVCWNVAHAVMSPPSAVRIWAVIQSESDDVR